MASNIAFNSFNAADVRKTVRLRNLNFNGANTGVVGIRITGGSPIAAGVLIIEDCLIDGNFGGTAKGISDERTAGGELYISNTTVRNTGAIGIVVNPGAGTTAGLRIDATLDNVRVQNSSFGIALGSASRVMINRSVFSGNSQAGIESDTSFSAVEVHVSNSVTSNNGVGIANGGGAVTFRLSNNDIVFNGTAITGGTQSFSNNRIAGNGAAGVAPTPIGTTTNPTGLQ